MTRRFPATFVRAGALLALMFALGVLGSGLFAPTSTAAQEPDPGTTPTCAERCQTVAQEMLARCEAAKGENCAARARKAYAECATRCQNPGGARPACGERCAKHAQELLRRCEAANGENCAARARMAHKECVTRCQNAGAEKPACANRCQAHAQEALRRCEAAGGENCAARARQAYNDCVAKCSTAPSPGIRPRP